MSLKNKSIPVNNFGDEYDTGISIERISIKNLPAYKEMEQSERHNWHSFHLLEKGTLTIEIDFKKHKIKSPSIIYMHPNQVHRIIAYENFTVVSWAVNNENLNPEYLKLLESITPAKPLTLKKDTYSLFSEAISITIKLSEQKTNKLYHSLLKDSCNALVGLVISQHLGLTKSSDKLSRFEIITKSFNGLLERNYTNAKRPADYAQKLNISTAYLNECIKNTTGYSVSHHIQQRVVLEAKRLLYHSDKSVKEIASELGFDDYPYFSRLFTKITGMTALTFRNKNHD